MYCLRGVSLSHAATLSMQPTSSTIDDIRLTTRRSLPHPRRQWRSPMPATIPLRFPSPVAGQVLDPPSGNPHPGRASADSTRRGTVPRESRWAGPPAGPDAAPGSRSPGASCRVPGRRTGHPARATARDRSKPLRWQRVPPPEHFVHQCFFILHISHGTLTFFPSLIATDKSQITNHQGQIRSHK